ncbi:uncharacterized protein PAC_09195 [Phialocephala subalpina]|uniref:Uncharacterized protein n=1 Tax=Phialocephala subalpina TaxID=576137 RepID=A0A1L7X2Q2_9HELO|nr:uncharacterized protein PAC_09195 [Phialocephala subalpina]
MAIEETSDIFQQAFLYVGGKIGLLGSDFKPEIVIIGGSGLSGIDVWGVRDEDSMHAEIFQVSLSVQMAIVLKVANQPPVHGHAGNLVFGSVGKQKTPVTLMNAEPQYYQVGDVVLLNDHINILHLAGIHPLRRPNLDIYGPRFLPLSDTYHLELRILAHKVCAEVDASKTMKIHEGVYAFVAGPTCAFITSNWPLLIVLAMRREPKVECWELLRLICLDGCPNRGDDPRLAEIGAAELMTRVREGKVQHEIILDVAASSAEVIKMLMIVGMDVPKIPM